MPVGCISGSNQARKGCAYKLRLVQPDYQINCKGDGCDACDARNIQNGDITFQRSDCSYNITSATWDQPLILKITGYVNGQYDNDDRTTYLRVVSQEGNHYADGDLFAWDNIQIPDIKVH